ncbi:hypothetical protein AB0D10_05425 [Kitasatospora sp. NPDC048545]|uniref:hypothetical protein n=1 Tax=Kitasatospora sp. NPDC048545 TaxID=3157208 RepID=UPI0033DBA853
MTSAYQQQLAQQLRAAEDELGNRRRQVADLAEELAALRARVIRTRTAWWSACRRAAASRSSREAYEAAAERWVDDLARLGHDQMKRAEQAEAALAALHEGEEPYEDERLVPTPAEWIWKWNRATPAERLLRAQRILVHRSQVSRCVWEHSELLDRAEQAEARIAAVRALADELERQEAYGGLADGYQDAADRIRAALEARQ